MSATFTTSDSPTDGIPSSQDPAPPVLRRVLVSVTDKRGLAELATRLAALGTEIVSTGGTAAAIRAAGVEVTDVEHVTGFAEMLDGRVKTLHPAIHAPIAARAHDASHEHELALHGLERFDAVVVNLYRFDAHAAHAESGLADALDQIDIGGPAMLRAAARNHEAVIPIVDPDDYHLLGIDSPDADTRVRLAAKCFRHVAAYDSAIADYLSEMAGEEFPETLTIVADRDRVLRYGDNPHQRAAVYRRRTHTPAGHPGITDFTQLAGGGLSWTNILDAQTALRIASNMEAPGCVAVKHAAPCAAACATELVEAIEDCRAGDPVSIFGGVIALNRHLSFAAAERLLPTFLEMLLVPSADEDAVAALSERWPKLRILAGATIAETAHRADVEARILADTVLVQEANRPGHAFERRDIASRRVPTDSEQIALEHAWSIVPHVPSNAIVLAQGTRTVGIGGGQPNRVDAARIACHRAGESAAGSVLASDGFIPMPDTVELAVEAGVTAVIQPGGSRRDADVLAIADAANIAMVYTGTRHFRH